jgi:site-specific DNA recombinase
MGAVIPINKDAEQDGPRLRAVIYLRVSTLEQAATDYSDDGYSLQAQGEACRRTAERLGADVVDEYVDRGKSARSVDRPQLQAMLKRIGSDRDVDLVIVHKIDRLARNRADDVQIVLAIKKAGASLISASENIDETPGGTLLHAIMAGVAEFYSANLGLEAKKGMKKKAKLGGTPGVAPLGYLNTRDRIDGKDVGIVVPDHERADHVRWAFEEYARGELSIKTLTNRLNEHGLTQRPTLRYTERPVRTSQIHQMLRNRYYVGIVTFDGVEYPGRHEALVDPVTFDTVQELLDSRSRSKDKPQKHDHPMKAVLHCGRCGRRLGLMHAKSRSGARYPYFFCLGRQERPSSCNQPLVRAELIEDRVLRHLESFELNLEERAGLRAAVRDWFGSSTEHAEAEVKAQRSRIAKLMRRREKVKEAYLADALDITDLKFEQKRIAHELLDAETIVQKHATQLSDIDNGVTAVLSLLARPATFYASGSRAIQRLMLQELFDKIWIVDERVVGVDFKQPYRELLAFEARAVVNGEADGMVTYNRADGSAMSRSMDAYLRRERPFGRLRADRTPTARPVKVHGFQDRVSGGPNRT